MKQQQFTLPSKRPTFCLMMLEIWLITVLLLPMLSLAQEVDTTTTPTSPTTRNTITLRAGVLHAPPFAMIQDRLDGSLYYEGYQLDLLDRLVIFAQEMDNLTLNFDLSPSPPQYGDALDLVANDCATSSQHVGEGGWYSCQQFDLIVGDYYTSPERSMRVDFTPAWLRTTMSTAKYIPSLDTATTNDIYDDDILADNHNHDRYMRHFMGEEEEDDEHAHDHVQEYPQELTTLAQAQAWNQSVCVPDGTYLMTVVQEKFPNIPFQACPSFDDCIAWLKSQRCALYVDDELLLRYRASQDDTLRVTGEHFNTQYLVWPLRDDLDATVARLFKKWMYAAVANATTDALYQNYFARELCPIGTAGDACELPCNPDHGKADEKGICRCISVKWTGDDCSVEVLEETNEIPSTFRILAYCMVAVNFSMIVVCGGWLFWQRHSTQVRVSQPYFLALVLLGCAISTSTIIPMAHNHKPGDVASCQAIPWLYSVGFSVTFGTLFAKIRRVYRIFQLAAKAGQEYQQSQSGMSSVANRQNVTLVETIAVIMVVLVVDVIILIWWSIMDPLTFQYEVTQSDEYGVPLESESYCTSDNWLLYAGMIGALHLTLLLTACYMCYKARAIPTQFNEGKYVTIAMVSNFQIFVMAVPILVILGPNQLTSFFVRALVVWMNDLVVVGVVFGNLMYNYHFDVAARDPEAMKAAISQAMQRVGEFENRRSSRSPQISQSQSSGTNSTRTPGAMKLQVANANKNTRRHQQRMSQQESSWASSAHPQSQADVEVVFDSSTGRDEVEQQQYPGSVASQSGTSSDAFSVPLPRNMFNSSVSTQVRENLSPYEKKAAGSDYRPNPSSIVLSNASDHLPKGSIMEENSSISEEDGSEYEGSNGNEKGGSGIERKEIQFAPFVVPFHTQTKKASDSQPAPNIYPSIRSSGYSDSASDEDMNETASRSTLPKPPPQPPSRERRLSSAAARVLNPREVNDMSWPSPNRERQANEVEVEHSVSSLVTGEEKFNDESMDGSSKLLETPEGASRQAAGSSSPGRPTEIRVSSDHGMSNLPPKLNRSPRSKK